MEYNYRRNKFVVVPAASYLHALLLPGKHSHLLYQNFISPKAGSVFSLFHSLAQEKKAVGSLYTLDDFKITWLTKISDSDTNTYCVIIYNFHHFFFVTLMAEDSTPFPIYNKR